MVQYWGGCVKKVNVDAFMDVYNAWARGEANYSECVRRLAPYCENGKCDRGTFKKWLILLMENHYKLEGLPFLIDEKGEIYYGI